MFPFLLLYNEGFLICGTMRLAQKKRYSQKYFTIHNRLVKRYGRATHCSNVECSYQNAKRFEWALIKGREYSDDPNDYIQLCPSCHRKYDFKPESAIKGGLKLKGKPALHRSRIIMKITDTDHWCYLDISKAAKENGILSTSIVNCLNGRSAMAGGFIWRYRE